MINDTFHRIPIGPKWRKFLESSRDRTRPKNYLTPEAIAKGRQKHAENLAKQETA